MPRSTGIQDLPAELLSKVFELTTGSTITNTFPSLDDILQPRVIPWKAAVQLSLVCKSWRRHVLHLPSLWRFIVRVRVRYLQDLLPRSQESPLALWCLDDRDLPLKISRVAFRLRELTICFLNIGQEEDNTGRHTINPNEEYDVLESVQLPHISVLHLEAPQLASRPLDSPMHVSITQLIQRSHANLEYLGLRHCDVLLSWGSLFFHKLRNFTFECSKDLPYQAIYRMLECMPKLEDLDFRLEVLGGAGSNFEHYDLNYSRRLAQLTLPHLTTLRLDLKPRHLIPLGRLVRFPSIMHSTYSINHQLSAIGTPATEAISCVSNTLSAMRALGSFGPSHQTWSSMRLQIEKEQAIITLSEDQNPRRSHAPKGYERRGQNEGMRLSITLSAYDDDCCPSAIGSLQALRMPTLTHLSISDTGMNVWSVSYNLLEEEKFEQVHDYCQGFFESLVNVEHLEFDDCVFSAETLGHIGPRIDSHHVDASSLYMPKLHTIIFKHMTFYKDIFFATGDAAEQDREEFLAPLIMLLKYRQELGSLKEVIFVDLPKLEGDLAGDLRGALPGVTITLTPRALWNGPWPYEPRNLFHFSSYCRG